MRAVMVPSLSLAVRQQCTPTGEERGLVLRHLSAEYRADTLHELIDEWATDI